MGMYLNFKLVDESLAEEACDWLDEQPEQERLRDIGRGHLWFWTPEDQAIEEAKENGAPWFHDIGEGQLKASGLPYDHSDEIKELWADLFEKLHEQYDVKVLSSSCALDLNYFTPEQIRRITDDGDALSGDAIEEAMELMEGEPA